MDRFFDNYVMSPMQTLVSDSNCERRPSAMPEAVADAGRCWTLRMDGSKNSSRLKRGRPEHLLPWRIFRRPSALTRIGCIQSAIDFREFSPTRPGSSRPRCRPCRDEARPFRKFFPQGVRIGTDKMPAKTLNGPASEAILETRLNPCTTGCIQPRFLSESLNDAVRVQPNSPPREAPS